MPNMPPRFQCLNAARICRHQDSMSRAGFSTTARAFADTPSSSAMDDLLSAIDSPSTQIKLPTPAQQRPSSSLSKPLGSLRTVPVNPQGNATANERIQKLVDHAASRNAQRSSTSNVMQELKNHKLASDLTKQIQRRWKAGDVYAPHDLSSAEMQKWKKRGRPETDAFDLLDMNPIEEYKNFAIMSEYMTPLGRIKGAAETGLRRVNQRRIAKAIRRSIGLGLMPSVHRHPEILYKQNARLRMQIGKLRSY